MRLVLWGDGESPHLLKWARALAPQLELWAASSRGFLPGFDALLPAERRLALGTQPRADGGNAALLRKLPLFANWLRRVRPDWVHAHYLTSHGTLAWLATTVLGAPGRLVGSAWGSDVLVTPQRSALQRGLIGRVLRACALTTSDSQHMAQRMRELGAGEVMCFPFGLETLPPLPRDKDDALFFANRGLEPIYAPQRVIDGFAAIAVAWPQARLVVANDGSLLGALQAQARNLGLQDQVRFVGRLDAGSAGRPLCTCALVLESAEQRFGVGVGAGGHGPRLRAAAVGPASQPRAGAQRRQRADPGRWRCAVAGCAAAAATARRSDRP